MAKDLSKQARKELKNPDAIQAELQKGFTWTTQHSGMVLGAIAVLFLIGGGFALKTFWDQRTEDKIQSKYFLIEKSLIETQAKFETPQTPPNADPKVKTPAPQPEVKASGDFEKDFGPIAGQLNEVIKESPKSKAAKMAALNLSQIQMQYQKYPEAQATLSAVPHDGKDLLSAMVQVQLGTIQADQKDCNAALSTWQKVLANSSAKALHGAVKLKTGLCYETMNDIEKARQTYTQLRDEAKDSAAGKTAEKYLRLLAQ